MTVGIQITDDKDPTPGGGSGTTLPPDIVDSVSAGGLVAISGQPAMLSNMSYSNSIDTNNLGAQNAIANQQAMNGVGAAVLGTVVGKVMSRGPLEARSAVDVLTNDEVAQTLLDLKAGIEGLSSPSSSHRSAPRPIHGIVFSELPVTLVFVDESPDDVKVRKEDLP